MDLTNFNSYFQAFFALNIAYATSDKFRDIIDSKVLKLHSNKVTKLHQYIKSVGILYDSERNIEKFIFLFMNEKDLQRKEESKKNGFGEYFKTSFLITGIYCLFVLIFSAFKQDNIYTNTADNYLIISPFVVLTYNLAILLFKKKLNIQKISPIIPIFILVVCIFLFGWKNVFFANLMNETDTNKIKIFSLFVAVSPYTLHVIKSLFDDIFLRIKLAVKRTCCKCIIYLYAYNSNKQFLNIQSTVSRKNKIDLYLLLKDLFYRIFLYNVIIWWRGRARINRMREKRRHNKILQNHNRNKK
ncbi:hypothetical protein HNP38_002396 [Chryseobacterium defluvii]|uniref:Uncharacterized protein n=1 Tax=Chryseobacterium defluvii TaxID=160396 RepID=A0A840KJN9_9FLAO|nr:hypothetical protein [Chryseobacterium defluvii]MBB4807092.1 hypothetical protein [Chryseobacterium defluvii]